MYLLSTQGAKDEILSPSSQCHKMPLVSELFLLGGWVYTGRWTVVNKQRQWQQDFVFVHFPLNALSLKGEATEAFLANNCID